MTEETITELAEKFVDSLAEVAAAKKAASGKKASRVTHFLVDRVDRLLVHQGIMQKPGARETESARRPTVSATDPAS